MMSLRTYLIGIQVAAGGAALLAARKMELAGIVLTGFAALLLVPVAVWVGRFVVRDDDEEG